MSHSEPSLFHNDLQLFTLSHYQLPNYPSPNLGYGLWHSYMKSQVIRQLTSFAEVSSVVKPDLFNYCSHFLISKTRFSSIFWSRRRCEEVLREASWHLVQLEMKWGLILGPLDLRKMTLFRAWRTWVQVSGRKTKNMLTSWAIWKTLML